MKLQLFILSALLLNALAWPVPDEEVSPVQAAALSAAQPEVKQAAIAKPLEETKTEIRPAATEQIKQEEKKIEKIELPPSAPDAEITQSLPEKKEKIEETKLAEKQTRADNQIGSEAKPVPVVEGPVAGAEVNKQLVDEIKPAVQDVQGKSASNAAEAPAAVAAENPAQASEQKKEELTAVETAPAIKSDLPTPAAEKLAEEKKEEQPARQERDNEAALKAAAAAAAGTPAEEAKTENSQATAAAATATAPATPEISPEIKNLEAAKEEKEAKQTLLAETKQPEQLAAEPAKEAELKSAPLEQSAEAAPAAPQAAAQPTIGDIPQPEGSQDLKALKSEEAKQEQPPAAAAAPAAPAPEAKKIEEKSNQAQAQENAIQPESGLKPEAPIALASSEPLKKLEETPAPALATTIATEQSSSSTSGEEKKSEESKESKESESESKESGESKEDKSN